jgi:dTDP-4-dehydrorhamnose reductase
LNALVFGAEGQLGSELVRLLGPETAVTHSGVSINEEAAVEALIARRKPDVVFNCAAYNAVDRAETEKDLAFAVNAEGPRIVAAACRRHGSTMVHFSTNFVFDGAMAEPYVESDEPAPLSVYAGSKLAGERAVQLAGAEVLIVRTAAVFGDRTGRSFPERILERARSGQPMRVVSDQMVNPTYAKDLAAAALDLVEQGFVGIVHAVNYGCTGWDDFARAVLTESGVVAGVESVSTEAYPTPARRPLNGCLATIRYHPLRPWREAVGDWASGLKSP